MYIFVLIYTKQSYMFMQKIVLHTKLRGIIIVPVNLIIQNFAGV